MNHSQAMNRLARVFRARPFRLLALAAALLGSSAAANADMYIRVTEDPSAPGATNGSTVLFTYTGDGQAPVLTSADFGGGTGIFGNFTILTISATSNSATPGLQGILTSNVSAIATSGSHILEVDISDDHFTFPANGYVLSSSASDTNAGTSTLDTHSYYSFFAPGSVPFGTTFPTSPITLNLGNGSNSATTTQAFFSSTQPYSLTSYTVFNSDSGSGILNTTDSSIVNVPEPSTVVLMGLGCGVLGLASLRRRFRSA